MNQLASDVLQVRLDGMASFYSSLAAALSEGGLSGSQLNEIFSKHVRGECVQCGIQITGDDMGHIAATDATTELTAPKLARLRQGYCARTGCNSYYYRIHFDDYPGLDWTKIRERADSQPAVDKTAAQEETTEGKNAIRNWLLIRLGAGFAVVLVLLLIWHIRYYGYVPVLQKPHKYTIDPASVNNRTSR